MKKLECHDGTRTNDPSWAAWTRQCPASKPPRVANGKGHLTHMDKMQLLSSDNVFILSRLDKITKKGVV
jgi:hypothetical protein